jgi:small-conductance mechanosensitive channel
MSMKFPDLLARWSEHAPDFLAALPVALGIMVVAFLLNLVLARTLAMLALRVHLSAEDLQPFRRVLRWAVRAIAIILILGVLGFQIGGIWAMLSTIFGLVAIGFVAVWSLLSHTTATVLLLFLRPFQVGDDLEFPGESVGGRVIDLNFFFTTLLDHEGVLHQVPNNLFFQKTLRRRKHSPRLSLAAQLNARQPAEVDRPPRLTPALTGTVPPPNPLMNLPDPATLAPPHRAKG